MAVNLGSIQTGMDVLDPTGEKIGTIDDILDVQTYSAADSQTDMVYGESVRTTTADTTVSTVPTQPSADRQYLKVQHGGFAGIGATDLYVPFGAVQNVVPGDSITINCTSDTCETMYGTKPDFLP